MIHFQRIRLLGPYRMPFNYCACTNNNHASHALLCNKSVAHQRQFAQSLPTLWSSSCSHYHRSPHPVVLTFPVVLYSLLQWRRSWSESGSESEYPQFNHRMLELAFLCTFDHYCHWPSYDLLNDIVFALECSFPITITTPSTVSCPSTTDYRLQSLFSAGRG